MALRAPAPAVASATWVPTPDALRVASLGRESVAASALWMAIVHRFSARTEPTPADVAWLRAAIVACVELDPDRLAPLRFGALMLAAVGDVPGHEAVLRTAIAHHPTDAWFPVALGMSHHLRGDAAGAAAWLEWAAAIEGGSEVWARAAARIRGELP